MDRYSGYQSRSSRAIFVSLRFMGGEKYLQKYRLQECLCEIERRIRTKRGLRRLVSAKVDNSF